METDAGAATYEVHMTRADGTLVTVKLDKGFSVLGVEDGMGRGDPLRRPHRPAADGTRARATRPPPKGPGRPW